MKHQCMYILKLKGNLQYHKISQLTSLQSQHKETFEQLSDKSRLMAGLKSELDRLTQHNHSLTEEVRNFSYTNIGNTVDAVQC